MEYDILGSRLHNSATGQYPEPVYSTHNRTNSFFNVTSNILPSIQLTVGVEAVYFTLRLCWIWMKIAQAKLLFFIFNIRT
jgi:hypothetical protein